MGSGLIFAGLGKGIADAGATYGNMMFKAAEAELADQRALQRAEALERIKADMQERQDLADAEATKRVREAADTLAQTRTAAKTDAELKGLIGRQSQIAGDAPAASEDELRELLKNPQYRKVYQDAGYIEKDSTRDPRLQRAEDLVAASGEVGASSRVRKAFEEMRTQTLKEIREENDSKVAQQRHDAQMAAITERSRQFDERKPILQQEADAKTTRAGASVTSAQASATRAARPAGSGGARSSGAADKPATTADLQRQINATKDDIALELGVPKNDVNTTLARLKTRAERGDKDALQKLDRIQPYLNELQGANDRMRQFKRSDATKASSDNQRAVVDALPKGAVQIGTSGGRPVYQTPDGKKFIAK